MASTHEEFGALLSRGETARGERTLADTVMVRTKIGEIVQRRVVSVPPEMAVADAIGVMTRERISSLVVVEGERPAGIFTERDIVGIAHRGESFEGPVGEVMSRPVLTVAAGVSIFEGYEILLANGIRHHVVVDADGGVLGVVTLSDMIRHLGLEYFVEFRKIEQIMSRSVVTLTPSVPVREVVAEMGRRGISCVVLAEDGVPVGIITERDVARLVVADGGVPPLSAGEVMSAPVKTVSLGTTVHNAVHLMQEHRIRRLVTVDGAGKIAGVVTQSDIVRGLEGKYIESLKRVIREKEEVLRQTTRELLDKSAYLDGILSSATDLAIVATDTELRIRYYNPAAERIFGRTGREVVGRTIGELHKLEGVVPLRFTRAREAVRKKGTYLFTARLDRGGETRIFESRISAIGGTESKLSGLVLTMRDVTELRRDEEIIRYMAYHDPLTSLPNRVLLLDRLGQALENARRNGARGALMMLDLDRFKDINDTLGHSVGDLLLKEVAGRLSGLLRKSDTVSRMGGDEFVLLLPTIASPTSASTIAGKIVKALRTPFTCDSHTLRVTTSVGVALFPDDGTDVETLLKNADIAMYRAKEDGRDTCRYFSPMPHR